MAKRSELAGVKKIVFLIHCRQPVHQTDICVVACRFPVGINLTCATFILVKFQHVSTIKLLHV